MATVVNCVKGVAQTLAGTNPAGGTITFVSPTAVAPVYCRAWLTGTQVLWKKWQPSAGGTFTYPANNLVDIIAGVNVTLNVTVT